MTVVLQADTSKMTHTLHCEWVQAQERNNALHFTRYDSSVDTEWFKERDHMLLLAEVLDRPRPSICQWCGCQV